MLPGLVLGESLGKAADSICPQKIFHLVVPFSPGTGPDSLARLIAPRIGQELHCVALVENRTGASGEIGARLVKNSDANNPYYLLTANPIVINSVLTPEQSVDPINDFYPLTQIATDDLVLVVPKNSPFANLDDFLIAAHSRGDFLTFASPGSGTPQFIEMALLESMSHIHLLHIPYKDTHSALFGLLGNQIDIMFISLSTARPHLVDGRLRALAIAAKKRNPLIPNLKTLGELKIQGVDYPIWNGIFSSKNISAENGERLEELLRKILSDPMIKAKIESLGLKPAPQADENFRVFLEKQIELIKKYKPVLSTSFLG
jgi:tripartite-type tricarboxylate transporter receptor subunit TctC